MTLHKTDSLKALFLNIGMLCMSLVFIYVFFHDGAYFSGALLIVVSIYFILGIIESGKTIRITSLTDEKGPLERIIVYLLFLILWVAFNYNLFFEEASVSNWRAKSGLYFFGLFAVFLIIDEMRKLQRGNQS